MIGCDIVHIPTFSSRLTTSPEIIAKLFTEQELLDSQGSLQSLAGKFAAKEACCKAIGMPAGTWLNIIIVKRKNGEPIIEVYHSGEHLFLPVSISHDGDYAMAIVVSL